jgi:hypothetical protein
MVEAQPLAKAATVEESARQHGRHTGTQNSRCARRKSLMRNVRWILTNCHHLSALRPSGGELKGGSDDPTMRPEGSLDRAASRR